ncbi:hypothetical protein D3C73_1163130 [compost metagenome]
MLCEQGQVVDHGIPAMLPGEQAEATPFGGTAVAAQVRSQQRIAGSAQRLAQALVAPGMFGHAVRQQHHGLDRRGRQPLVHVQAAMLAGRQPEGVVRHGGSFALGYEHSVCASGRIAGRAQIRFTMLMAALGIYATSGLPANVG